MQAILTAMISAILMLGHSQAQPDEEDTAERVKIEHRTLEHDGQTYAWAIMIPESAEEGGRALLFLHGAGECGTDGEKNLAVGLPTNVKADPDRWPFVVIVPQKPTRESEWEDHEDAVLKMLDLCAEEGLIDSGRLAITGLSQGGHGTIMIGSRYPDRFKAAASVCGYVDRRFSEDGTRAKEVPAEPTDESVIEAAKGLESMPVWLFHGEVDSVVPVEESRALFAALNTTGATCAYTELEGVNHGAWDPAYADPDLAEWFKGHTGDD